MGIELEASASIGVAIGDKLDGIKELLGKSEPKPLIFSVPASGVGGGAIRVGRPPAGKLWNILTVSCLGTDDHTAEANVFVSLYVDSDPFNLGLGQCLIPGLAVPSFTSISKGTTWAHGGGEVVANVVGSGVGASTSVNVTLGVAEWTVKDVSAGSTK
jgi:hypothetical protein